MGQTGAIVVGGSAGSHAPLVAILRALPEHFPLPVLVVRHLHPSDDGSLPRRLQSECRLEIVEPNDKQPVLPGCVFTAPANYHMLIERDGTIALSIDAKVNWSRPSIDVLFESAADVWGAGLTAVVLSGASCDGTAGLRAVRAAGGHAIAQDPETAETPMMPRSAIRAGVVDAVLPPSEIGRRLGKLGATGTRPTRQTTNAAN